MMNASVTKKATKKSKKAKAQPEDSAWWCRHRPHPRWCGDPRGDHSDGDCESRWCREVVLSHQHTDSDTGERVVNPRAVDVFLKQRYGECIPRVVISPSPLKSGTRFEFTRDEAEHIARGLVEAVLLIDGQDVGDPR